MSEQSKALEYVKSKGWEFRESSGQLTIETCPISHCSNSHFYIAIGGTKDGLWDCKKCGESGNLRRLMEHCGDRLEGVQSFKDMAGHRDKEPLPNVEKCHAALLENLEAMRYLEDVRGFKLAVIQERKLGLSKRRFKELGEVEVLVIPYMVGDQCVYAKFRTLPPTEKKFGSAQGHDAPLYNEHIIQPGLEELIFVEGEADALSLFSHGIHNVVAVPGANTKKAAWVTKLDKAAPKTIYLMYDSDHVGQKAAYEMAIRIGLDKVLKITLPEGVKDINDWFSAGHTTEEFDDLKRQATKFDVAGITNLDDALDQIVKDIDGQGGKLLPKYRFPWESLNKKLGGAEDGDRVDIIAEEKRGKTTFALNIVDHLVAQGFPALVYCLEMPASRMARKWASMVTETDDSPAQNEEEAALRGKAMKQAVAQAKEVARNRDADLLFGYTNSNDVEEVFDTIKQAVRRYGVKVLVFDNLQLFADSTLKNPAYRTTHISQLSKRFKRLATELNIFVILIIQPNRVRDGQIVDANNADGSSQVQKDCDAMIALHRTMKANMSAQDFEQMGYIDEEVTFEPQTLVRISRSRYAAGGVCTLWFEGNISKFREFDEAQRLKAEAERTVPNNGAIPTEKVYEA